MEGVLSKEMRSRPSLPSNIKSHEYRSSYRFHFLSAIYRGSKQWYADL
ncbi:hypothetical protein M8C21_029742 [Ambrosia artemisiifolia]|uniref:Uncharacterized protein n=1 Tax=Ambrosia artemisiifolia TaxID=4212 RepID=A0AAD5GAF2_AMBAR|nr:hypothetical protein M8C21_029742 [Ambrosia artemisiifolia]